MRTLGASVVLVMAGLLAACLGLFGVIATDLAATTGLSFIGTAVLLALAHVMMESNARMGRKGRLQ